MRFREFSCLVVSVFVTLATRSAKAAHFRIGDGRKASIKEFPYQVSIEVQGWQWCGGSIIAPRYVLTAVHCVKWAEGATRIATKDLLVRVGNDECCTGGTVHQVEKVILHEQFDEHATVDKFDIAVLKMVKSFRYSDRVKPIRLATEAPEEGQKAWVTVFGKQEMRSQSSTHEHLIAKELPIVSLTSCRTQLDGVADDMICAGYSLKPRHSCQNDSGGGPLAIKNVLVGIIGWGNGCGREGYPGIYTNVAHYYDWIIQKITAA